MATDLPNKLCGQMAALRRYARALVGNATDADDLVQECLTRALANGHVWNGVRHERSYLFKILHNAYVDHVRKHARLRACVPLDNEAAARVSVQPTQWPHMQLADLARGLRTLPEEQRCVVLLVGLEGLKYEEVAEALDVPVGTVMSRLHRGREALRRFVAGAEEDAAQARWPELRVAGWRGGRR